MSSLKQRYENFADFMQHNTKGVEVNIKCDNEVICVVIVGIPNDYPM